MVAWFAYLGISGRLPRWQELVLPFALAAPWWAWLRLFAIETYPDRIQYRSLMNAVWDSIHGRQAASGRRERRLEEIGTADYEFGMRGQPFVCLAIRPRPGVDRPPLLINLKVFSRTEPDHLLRFAGEIPPSGPVTGHGSRVT